MAEGHIFVQISSKFDNKIGPRTRKSLPPGAPPLTVFYLNPSVDK